MLKVKRNIINKHENNSLVTSKKMIKNKVDNLGKDCKMEEKINDSKITADEKISINDKV